MTIIQYAKLTNKNRRYVQRLVKNNRLDLLEGVKLIRKIEGSGRGFYELITDKNNNNIFS